MLTTAGFDTGTAVSALTTFSLIGIGGLLALPVFTLPAILLYRHRYGRPVFRHATPGADGQPPRSEATSP
jgi:hypothetical protein